METSKNSTVQSTGEQLTFLLEGFHVSRSQMRVSKMARVMSVTSGRRCLESSEKLDRPSLLARTLLVSSAWHSKIAFLKWRISGTIRKHLLFQLVPSEQFTGGIACGFWPTPTASDYKGASSGTKKIQNGEISMLRYFLHHHFSKEKRTSYPNPKLLEAMMGYPIGWTELKDSEMLLSRKSRSKSLKQ